MALVSEDGGVASAADAADSEAREARMAEASEMGGRMPNGWPPEERSGRAVVAFIEDDEGATSDDGVSTIGVPTISGLKRREAAGGSRYVTTTDEETVATEVPPG